MPLSLSLWVSFTKAYAFWREIKSPGNAKGQSWPRTAASESFIQFTGWPTSLGEKGPHNWHLWGSLFVFPQCCSACSMWHTDCLIHSSQRSYEGETSITSTWELTTKVWLRKTRGHAGVYNRAQPVSAGTEIKIQTFIFQRAVPLAPTWYYFLLSYCHPWFTTFKSHLTFQEIMN